MKKVLLAVAVVATFGLASCGGPSICDCVELDEERMEADDKEAWEKEHESDMKACKDMKDEKEEEWKDLEGDELKEAWKEYYDELDACESDK